MTQTRNYCEVPVQGLCLYFCQNIHNPFQFLLFLLLQMGVASHPITHPSPLPMSAPD